MSTENVTISFLQNGAVIRIMPFMGYGQVLVCSGDTLANAVAGARQALRERAYFSNMPMLADQCRHWLQCLHDLDQLVAQIENK
jgi:hypothetical protein